MAKKPKLLWCGDIVAKTGFARVTENVLPYLAKQFNIVVLGNKPPLVKTSGRLKIDSARDEWKKLIAQVWRRTKPVWEVF